MRVRRTLPALPFLPKMSLEQLQRVEKQVMRMIKSAINVMILIIVIAIIFRFKAPYQSWALTVQVLVTTLLVLLAILLLVLLLIIIMRNCRHLSLPIVSLLGAGHGRKPAKSEPCLVVMTCLLYTSDAADE